METLVEKSDTAKIFKASNPIPVLHIIKSLGRGGAEKLLPETLIKHNKEKFQFHYIYFLPWKDQMVKEIELAGGNVKCMPAKNNLAMMSKVLKIAAYVQKNKIRLIHCHLPWAGVVGRIVGKITGVPVIYTEHNKWERYHKLTYHLNKISFSSQNKVIAVSEDVAKSIKTFYRHQKPDVKVVLNGINTEKYCSALPVDKDVRKDLGIPSSAVVIGLACVFRVQKRLIIWLDIAARLHAIFPGVHFILAGDGPLRNEVAAKAKDLMTSDFVHLVGLQSEMRPYLKAMDIFMMTSEFEGLPIALLEAMSMECMPACTAAGGIPELIKDGVNGLLVPVDEPLKLVDQVSELLRDFDKIKRMGKEARKTVEKNFSMQKMVNELEIIYDELLNERQ